MAGEDTLKADATICKIGDWTIYNTGLVEKDQSCYASQALNLIALSVKGTRRTIGWTIQATCWRVYVGLVVASIALCDAVSILNDIIVIAAETVCEI